jgi:hypothetical protein
MTERCQAGGWRGRVGQLQTRYRAVRMTRDEYVVANEKAFSLTGANRDEFQRKLHCLC